MFMILKQMEVANIIEITEKLWAKNSSYDSSNNDRSFYFNICDKAISMVINLDDLTNALKEDELFIKTFNKVNKLGISSTRRYSNSGKILGSFNKISQTKSP